MNAKSSSDGDRAIARRVAARIQSVPGIVGVVLGGSLATGTAREGSDVDLGLYYHGSAPFDLDDLRSAACDVDDRDSVAVTEPGEWGTWVDGGAWLQVDGRPVDLLYRDYERASKIADEAERGVFVRGDQVGHPWGFPSYAYVGEAHYAEILTDPEGRVARLKARAATMPPPLAATIIQKGLFEAQFSEANLRKAIPHGDVAYVSAHLGRAVSCLIHALFARNGTWLINEKGALARAAALPLVPAALGERVAEILGAAGCSRAALDRTADRLASLTRDVASLCNAEAERADALGGRSD